MSQAQLCPTASPFVSLHSGRPATTSLEVAKFFGKRHDNVVRDIETISAQTPENFLQLNFEETTYPQETPMGTKQVRMFILHRDGFMLLVMGYTGKKAMQLKIAYIEAFNAMEAQLMKSAPRRGRKALPAAEPKPVRRPTQQFDEAPFLAFAEECRHVHKQAWDMRDRLIRQMMHLLTPIQNELILRGRFPQNTWNYNLPEEQWFRYISSACDKLMTYPSDCLGNNYNPGMMLLGYARALNG